MSMDWLPTLLSVAGGKPDPAYPADGVDLMPVLRGHAPEFERTVFWRTQDMMAARKGDWKYVRWDTREYLANLAEDETENANFKLKNAAMFEQLKRAYEDWTSRCCRSHPRPDAARGKPGEPRAQPRTCATLAGHPMVAVQRAVICAADSNGKACQGRRIVLSVCRSRTRYVVILQKAEGAISESHAS
jgi:hypothetical protein